MLTRGIVRPASGLSLHHAVASAAAARPRLSCATFLGPMTWPPSSPGCFTSTSGSSLALTRSVTSSHSTSTHSSAAVPTSSGKEDKKRFSKTLNLPKTAFAIRADSAKRDHIWRERSTDRLYEWQYESNEGPLFVLHDGPPYANGPPHTGHAMNKILKDMINRYHVLMGRRVHYVPGWDCHGLPIELKALKRPEFANRSPASIPVNDIRQAAREEAEKSIVVQRDGMRKFGVMADWSPEGTYRTFDKDYELRQLEVFGEMARKGLIYRAHRPVFWSPSTRTALAEAELEYSEAHRSRTVYVRFPVQVGAALLEAMRAQGGHELEGIASGSSELDALVWTTTPWTLPSNMAMTVNADLDYSIVRVQEGHRAGQAFLVATERMDVISSLPLGRHLSKKEAEAQGRSMLGPLKELLRFPGSVLLDSTYRHAFLGQGAPARPILAAAYVTSDSGTGLVHSAPAHGADDYLNWRASGAARSAEDIVSPVDDDGRYTAAVGPSSEARERLMGKEVLGDGGTEVIRMLDEQGWLLSEVPLVHKYPYDWRSKQPVITRATSQWFANVDAIKDRAVRSLDNATFYPPSGRARLQSTVQSRSEWCISRQRVWGVPIPVVYDAATDEALLTPENVAHICQVLKERGTDHWWVGEAEDFVAPQYHEKGKSWRKGRDTVDVWFDSGTSWTLLREQMAKDVKHQKQGESRSALADVYLEGSDQHRGWFQSSLLTCIATGGTSSPPAPFANVITHGFLVDQNGRKMSKSIGNVVDPLHYIFGGGPTKEAAFGTDTLRLWVARGDYTRDLPVGSKIMKEAGDALRKVRNTFRFLLANLGSAGKGSPTLEEAELSLLDRFILNELHELDAGCRSAYETFDFARVARQLSQFVNGSLSTLYLDVTKDSLYSDISSSPARLAILAVFDQILRTMTSIVAPIAPHLAEEVAHYHAGGESDPADDAPWSSVFQAGWQRVPERWSDAAVKAQIGSLLSIREHVLVLIENARQAKHLKESVEADLRITGVSDGALKEALQGMSDLSLANLFGVSHVSFDGSDAVTASSWNLSSSVEGQSRCQIEVRSARDHKCPRCWTHRRVEGDEVCGRCAEALRHTSA